MNSAVTWIEALGTTGAAVVAAIGFVVFVLDRRKQYARQFSVTIRSASPRAPGYRSKAKSRHFIVAEGSDQFYEVEPDDPTLSDRSKEFFGKGLARPALEVRLHLANGSPEEVTSVTVELLDDIHGDALIWEQLAIPPGFTDDFYVNHFGWENPGEIQDWKLRLRVRFTDPTGKRWERVTGSKLVRVKDS